jgi:serine/threonine protein kinase
MSPLSLNSKPLVDAGLLRRSLRLVHCLQKERGASCACLNDGDDFLAVARLNSNHAMLDCQDILHDEAPVQLILSKVRNMLDERCISSHRALVFFNTLISAVLHEHVLRYTTKTNANMMQRQTIDKTSDKQGFGRIKSDQNLMSIADSGITTSNVRVRRTKSIGLSTTPALDGHSLPYPVYSASSDLFMAYSTDAIPTFKPLSPLPPVNTLLMEKPFNEGEQEHGVSIVQSTQDHVCSSRLSSLLQLLGIFVIIKESTGKERASLYSMLASGQAGAAAAETGLLLNDVVLEIENQRRQLDKLQHIRGHSLQNLVQELVVMSEDMQQVQNLLSSGCLLQALEEYYSAQQLWDVLSVYMDKLHSLELLIVEEMELALPQRNSEAAMQNLNAVPNLLLDAFGETSTLQLQRAIQAMSPDDVKKRLLGALKQQNHLLEAVELDTGNDIGNKGVDELLRDLYGNVPAMKEWEIDVYELKFLKRIGQGAAGTTYLAEWSGEKVAVKVASITELGLDGWRTEVQALQKLHHPNIIRLLGSVYHQNPLTFCLVLEYCDAGDLASAMMKTVPKNFFFHVATSIAKGLVYLHHRGVIHRDIKPLNILLQGDLAAGQYSVKLTDFGVAADLNNLEDRSPETGTYRWMSPEIIRHETYTQTADVYSYGIILWQLLTREDPFADLGQIEAAAVVAMEFARPPFPPDTPSAVKDLIEICWNEDPSSRPSFVNIIFALSQLDGSINEAERTWLDAPLGHPVYRKRPQGQSKSPSSATLIAPTGSVHVGEPNNSPDVRKKKKFGLFVRKSSHF